MSKLTQAPIVAAKPTSFFAKNIKNEIKNIESIPPAQPKPLGDFVNEHQSKEIKKKGRPILDREDKKEVRLSISLPSKLNDDLERGLQTYNESRQKDDIFFKPISKNEFLGKLLQTSEELDKLLKRES